MIDPMDFHRLAESLVSWPSAREEHFRTAISRAYIVRWGMDSPCFVYLFKFLRCQAHWTT